MSSSNIHYFISHIHKRYTNLSLDKKLQCHLKMIKSTRVARTVSNQITLNSIPTSSTVIIHISQNFIQSRVRLQDENVSKTYQSVSCSTVAGEAVPCASRRRWRLGGRAARQTLQTPGTSSCSTVSWEPAPTCTTGSRSRERTPSRRNPVPTQRWATTWIKQTHLNQADVQFLLKV